MKYKRILILFLTCSLLLCGCGNNGDSNNHLTNDTTTSENSSLQESSIEIDITDLSNDVKEFSYGKGWYLDKSSEEWTCIDVDGNILFTLPYGYVPASGFIQNLCLIKHEGYRCTLIDESGSQVFTDLTTGDSECLMLSENNGKINIWLHIIKDTYDGHSEILRVVDGEGMTISEYAGLNMGHIKHMGQISSFEDGLELRNLGEGMYQCGGYVFNTNNNSYFRYEDYRGFSVSVRDFDGGYGMASDGKLIDSNGNVIYSTVGGAEVGSYREGVFFMGDWEEIFISGKYYDTYRGSFYNSNGQVELDISQYSLLSVPVFEEGYCIMEILNEAGVTFTAVMDRAGEFLFEPIEGVQTVKISEEMIVVNGDSIQIYDIKENMINTISDNIERVYDFNDGWAIFRTSQDNQGFIDKNGNHLKVFVEIDE